MDEYIERHVFARNIEHAAAKTPKRAFASIPNANWKVDGWQDITFEQMADGINFVSRWLDLTLGERRDLETLAYMGPNDLRYSLMVGAAMKTRRQVLFLDGGVSPNGRLALLDTIGCSALICTDGFSGPFLEVQKERPNLRLEILPSLERCFDSTRKEPSFPYVLDFPQAADDPVIIMHTSGTTGVPKPVKMTHKVISMWCSTEDIGRQSSQPLAVRAISGRFLMPVPLVWSMGLMCVTAVALAHSITPVLLPGDGPKPPTAAYLESIIARVQIDTAILPAYILREMAKKPESLQQLEKLKYVFTAGAPLEKWVGDTIWKHVPLQQGMGTTEGGPLTSYKSTAKDWTHLRFSPFIGYRMDEREDGLHELVIEKKPELAKYQAIFAVFPDLQEYHTNDLFEPHQEYADYWRYAGRADDFVKLSKQEKFHAGHVESALERHPLIQAAIKGGEMRPKPFLLVELSGAATGTDSAKLMEDIWKAVQDVNQGVDEAVRIPRELIILSDVQRPFKRLGKGPVNRRETLAIYAKDVDAVYAS